MGGRCSRRCRRERVERAVGPRRSDDVEHDRAVGRELDLALVRDARHEQRLRRHLRPCGDCGDSGECGGDEKLAKHDPGPG